MATDAETGPAVSDFPAPQPGSAQPGPTPVSTETSVPAPRPGDLTRGWSILTMLLWGLVTIALAAVWGVSAQLGLATWWLGPRGDRNPIFIRFLPFVPPFVMLVRTVLAKRWNGVWGIIAGAGIVIIGVFDFPHVTGLAWLEVLIGGAAVLGSIATLSGTYRRARA